MEKRSQSAFVSERRRESEHLPELHGEEWLGDAKHVDSIQGGHPKKTVHSNTGRVRHDLGEFPKHEVLMGLDANAKLAGHSDGVRVGSAVLNRAKSDILRELHDQEGTGSSKTLG